MDKIYLNDEFEKIWIRIKNRENITVFRYGDGERSLMIGKAVSAQEGWKAPESQTDLGKALVNTLDLDNENVYYGVSCPCCDRPAYYWYMSHVKSKNVTFANLFVNSNYRKFIQAFEELNRDAVVIANHNGEGKRIGNLNILKYYSVGDQCVQFYSQEIPKLVEQIKKDFGDKENILYAVSAGPLSEPIIYELYKNNPNNAYIDFGSSIDCYIHDHDTRPYTDARTIYAKRNCWMHSPASTSFDVTCVCNMYKRPESLVKQVQALQKQTLKPKEIILYQDGINGGYKIDFSEEFLKQFASYKKAETNTGVWERFRFAKDTAKSPYICVFDDDTIPGESWLENCHYNMMEQEGIYGTNGIFMTDDHSYPESGHFHVGWHAPVEKRVQVDFVGHSWFFPKKCLDYMFDGTQEFQNLKYVGEDMCISFKAKEHGIKTFVPPHTVGDYSVWGSIPLFGNMFGVSAGALSVSMNNLNAMQEAVRLFVKGGWKPVFAEEPKALGFARKQVRRGKIKKFKLRLKNFLRRKLGKS